MSEVRLVKRREPWGGYVDTDLLPAEGGCNLLCLTDRQVAIIRSFVFPMVRWPTRWVQPFQGQLYWVDTPTQLLLADEVDDLDLEVNGGHNVPCQELADALGTLITIANSAGSVGSVLANIPDEDWLPSVAETPPEEGVPPDGFDTWQAYLEWKCQAAWAVWHEVDRVLTMLEGFYGLAVTASVIIPTIFAFTSISWVAVPVSGVAILVVSILAMVAVWGSNVLIMDQMRTWWSDHQDAIVCQLYNSGDAATALAAIGDNIEDAIQAIEWGALLPFAGPLGDALGTVIGVFQNNSLVNPLFKLITGVVLIEVECPCVLVPLEWYHFDSDDQGWVHTIDISGGRSCTAGWVASPHNGNDPQDSSPGALEVHQGAGGYEETHWSKTYAEGFRPTATAGMKLYIGYCDNTNNAPGVRLGIEYADDANDTAWYTGGIAGWSVLNCPVSSGNVGKEIKRLFLGQNFGSGQGEWWFDIDNAHLL